MAKIMKKSLPWLLILIIITTLLLNGLIFLRVRAQTNLGTSVTVANAAPDWTVYPYEDPASYTDSPTNAGLNVTFKATGTDPNNDQYYLAICKTNSITPGNNAPPTCGGGAWCISSATNSESQATCSYQTQDADPESNNWWAFVCDKTATNPACSSSHQGSGHSGSPFKVNHRPSFTGVADCNYANPAASCSVTAIASDADTDGHNDTVSLYVCKQNDFTGTGCGAGGTWCSVTGQSSNPSCNFNVPRPDGSYNYYPYVIDNHHFAASGAYQGSTQDFEVNNVAPSITNTTIQLLDTDESGDLTLTQPEAQTTGFKIKFTVTDNNSCLKKGGGNEIASATANVRMTELAASACRVSGDYNANNCYPGAYGAWNLICSQDAGTCAGENDTEVNWTCTFPLWYVADPTVGTPTPPKNAYNWKAEVKAIDDDNADSGWIDDDDGNELGLFMAYAYQESSIGYGNLAPGQKSVSSATATIVAKGNTGLDAEYSGTNMTASGKPDILVSQQKYDFTDQSWDSMTYILSSAPIERELNCPKTTNPASPQTKPTYFRISIPSGQPAGTYTGTDTLSGVVSEDNW
ncbi:MAG: hypothetical protein N2259_00200 [Patescibacteria group bacterium]|nr:hypothetical protein [Patescibacteria group bacterium]